MDAVLWNVQGQSQWVWPAPFLSFQQVVKPLMHQGFRSPLDLKVRAPLSLFSLWLRSGGRGLLVLKWTMYCLWTARFGHILLHYFVLHLWIINTAAGANVKVNRVRFCIDRCETLFGLEVVCLILVWISAQLEMPVTMREERRARGGRNVKLSHQNTVLTSSTSSALLFYNSFCAHSDSEIKAQLEFFLCLE